MEELKHSKYKRYKIIGNIGSGGWGIVYKAFDPKMEREVALKILKDNAHKERFHREIKKLAQFKHTNIVQIFDTDEDHGKFFFVMELIKGRSLNKIANDLDIHNQLDIQKILDIIIQIAKALDYVHKQGIIHRDIKPSNILIDKNFNAKLIDFGIAKSDNPYELSLTGYDVLIGSCSYMSPEHITHTIVDGCSDIFSLGIVFYELVTRENPFKSDSQNKTLKAIIEKTPVKPYKLNSSVHRKLSNIIMKSLSKKTEERFRTGKEMAKAIKKFNEEKTTKSKFNKNISNENIGIPSNDNSIKFNEKKIEGKFNKKTSKNISNNFINENKDNPEVENNNIGHFEGDVSKEIYKQIFGLNEEKRPVSYIKNNYIDNNNDTISDIVTGLMWQKSGSEIDITYKDALIYIDEINNRCFAGYDDWRLSTMIELITLLEPQKNVNNLYISSIFEKKQDWCWSLNTRSPDTAWCIDLKNGCVDWSRFDAINYVRAVRTLY